MQGRCSDFAGRGVLTGLAGKPQRGIIHDSEVWFYTEGTADGIGDEVHGV